MAGRAEGGHRDGEAGEFGGGVGEPAGGGVFGADLGAGQYLGGVAQGVAGVFVGECVEAARGVVAGVEGVAAQGDFVALRFALDVVRGGSVGGAGVWDGFGVGRQVRFVLGFVQVLQEGVEQWAQQFGGVAAPAE